MCKTDFLTAANPQTSPTELVILSENESAAIRARVAENPSTPLYLLAYLAQDANCDVRVGVASNPKVTMNVLEWLVHDRCADVRYALAEDYNMPEPVLLRLTHDENPYVAARARSTMARMTSASLTGGVVCQLPHTVAKASIMVSAG